MSGDIILTCDWCGQQYYQVNGHDCEVRRRKMSDVLSPFPFDYRLERLEEKVEKILKLLEVDDES